MEKNNLFIFYDLVYKAVERMYGGDKKTIEKMIFLAGKMAKIDKKRRKGE